ncbi:MAG: UDP-glucose 4-epimerase GalE [Betaproteobacteria bacterium]
MAVLVTGGAGYIGSVFVGQLLDAGEPVVVLDDLSRGQRAAVDPRAAFYRGRTGDRELVARLVREHAVDACAHFAAFAYVGESVSEPARYYENNFTQAAVLFETLARTGVKHVVFSSTCATYGVPRQVPIPEQHPQWPINPYGWSKLFVERLLADFDRSYGLRFVALRYFNAAGASLRCGEAHDPETHLVPLVLAVAAGRRRNVVVFGRDYDTPDGTAIRDYIHVEDLGEAHLLALRHLRKGGASQFLNLGNGIGYSVLEVIDAARRVTGHEVAYELGPRREGDPPRLVGDASKAREVLGWVPKRPELDAIVRSAWDWLQAHPGGY